MIQAVYISDTGSMDIFVIGAMFFSIISATFHLIHGISRKLRSKDLQHKEEYYYRVKKTFIMKIECKEFRSYHKYIHKLLANVICSVLGIDNTGNVIEVFYIRTARHCIQAYVQVSNFDLNNSDKHKHKHKTPGATDTGGGSTNNKEVFSRFLQIGKENDNAKNNSINSAFKQELNERLQLKLEQPGTLGFEEGDDIVINEPGQSIDNCININSKMKISIHKDAQGLSQSFKDVVSIESSSLPAVSVRSRSPSASSVTCTVTNSSKCVSPIINTRPDFAGVGNTLNYNYNYNYKIGASVTANGPTSGDSGASGNNQHNQHIQQEEAKQIQPEEKMQEQKMQENIEIEKQAMQQQMQAQMMMMQAQLNAWQAQVASQAAGQASQQQQSQTSQSLQQHVHHDQQSIENMEGGEGYVG